MSLPLYTLATDTWSPHLSLRCYLNGQPWGYAGHASHTPRYATHADAIRAVLEGTHPMPALAHHRPLSAAEVMDLRVSARSPSYDSGGSGSARMAVGFNASSGEYELRASPIGPCLASHADIAVIGALLRGERFEPGFITRALDPAYVADELALDADAREAARRRRAADAAQTRARAREAEDRAAERRRLTPLHDAPDDLTAEDLFRDL